jgi:hypothetical protein
MQVFALTSAILNDAGPSNCKAAASKRTVAQRSRRECEPSQLVIACSDRLSSLRTLSPCSVGRRARISFRRLSPRVRAHSVRLFCSGRMRSAHRQAAATPTADFFSLRPNHPPAILSPWCLASPRPLWLASSLIRPAPVLKTVSRFCFAMHHPAAHLCHASSRRSLVSYPRLSCTARERPSLGSLAHSSHSLPESQSTSGPATRLLPLRRSLRRCSILRPTATEATT